MKPCSFLFKLESMLHNHTIARPALAVESQKGTTYIIMHEREKVDLVEGDLDHVWSGQAPLKIKPTVRAAKLTLF